MSKKISPPAITDGDMSLWHQYAKVKNLQSSTGVSGLNGFWGSLMYEPVKDP